MTDTYTISELSREFEITPRTIRFYEDQGLLFPSRNGQHRIYSSRDRVHLKLILRGKRLGLSLAESKELIGLYDPASSNVKQLKTMLTTLQDQDFRLKQKMKDLKAMQKEIRDAELRCREALEHSLQKNN